MICKSLKNSSLKLLLGCSIFTVSCDLEIEWAKTSQQSYVSGMVVNNDTGSPISCVIISDGYTSAITDSNGFFNMNLHHEARHVFYSVPEEYEIFISDGVPNFYVSIDPDAVDSVQVDFKLTPLKNGIEDNFVLFCVADIHVRNQATIDLFRTETIEDIKKKGKRYENVYGINLGDLVDDMPELFNELKDVFGESEIPFFHTIGNHDYYPGENNTIDAARYFEKNFGPINYSFNRGNAHIIVMNNVQYLGNIEYSRGFNKETLRWLQSNLNYVPDDKLIIICVHIPIFHYESFPGRDKLMELLDKFNDVYIISGHLHRNVKYRQASYTINEHIISNASGLWWGTVNNKVGTPRGYGVFEISGNKIKNYYYKAVQFDRDYQMKMYAPYSFGNNERFLIVNAWDADNQWKVEMFENGILHDKMERYSGYDPGAYEYMLWRGFPYSDSSRMYIRTNNLYRLKPKSSSSIITIKATDPFGNTYYQDQFISDIQEFRRYSSDSETP